jgi:DnaK suppressor protein
MSTHLTAGQRAGLRAALDQREHQLARRVADHHEGGTRAEHAHQVLMQDGDDAPQRAADREVDLALSDLELRELAEVREAQARLDAGEYGACADCGSDIAFDRLRAEPWALRCVDCEAAHERGTGPQRTRR